MQHGLSAAEARKQAKMLARERALELRKKDREKLRALRERIKEAKERRSRALTRARSLCRGAKLRVRAQVKELRKRERERLRREIDQMIAAERGTCAARKDRVRKAGHSVAEKRRKLLEEERRTQALIARGRKRAEKLHERSSAKERRQESDDAVRGNLPPELRRVWDTVKHKHRGSTGRASRTEAFLEWAESHPEDVIRIRSDQADREVSQLVRQQHRLEQKLRQHKPYQMCPRELETLKRMGLAPSQVAARRERDALAKPTPAFAGVPF